MFSVARELLVNAAKHAQASFVSLVVEREGEEIVLEVADDGKGIDPARRAAALARGSHRPCLDNRAGRGDRRHGQDLHGS